MLLHCLIAIKVSKHFQSLFLPVTKQFEDSLVWEPQTGVGMKGAGPRGQKLQNQLGKLSGGGSGATGLWASLR